MIYKHYNEVPLLDFRKAWPNFLPKEIACSHCGQVLVNEAFLDVLQRQRSMFNSPIHLNSCYRCPAWNALVKGAPLSQHKFGAAGDQALLGRDVKEVMEQARAAGFIGFGIYKTFLHADIGKARQWAS